MKTVTYKIKRKNEVKKNLKKDKRAESTKSSEGESERERETERVREKGEIERKREIIGASPRTEVRIRRTKAQLAHCCAALPSYCASNRTVPLSHPCRAVECFRAECLRRRAGKHARCRDSVALSHVQPTPFSIRSAVFERRTLASIPRVVRVMFLRSVNVKEQFHEAETCDRRARDRIRA